MFNKYKSIEEFAKTIKRVTSYGEDEYGEIESHKVKYPSLKETEEFFKNIPEKCFCGKSFFTTKISNGIVEGICGKNYANKYDDPSKRCEVGYTATFEEVNRFTKMTERSTQEAEKAIIFRPGDPDATDGWISNKSHITRVKDPNFDKIKDWKTGDVVCLTKLRKDGVKGEESMFFTVKTIDLSESTATLYPMLRGVILDPVKFTVEELCSNFAVLPGKLNEDYSKKQGKQLLDHGPKVYCESQYE